MKKLQILIAVFLIASCYTVSAQSPDDYIVHTIKKGEVLPVLAKKYGITPEAIAKLNNFNATHVLHVGDKVKLPANAVYRDVPDSVLAPKPATPSVAVTKQVPAVKPADTASAKPKQPAFVTHVIEHGEVYSVLAKKYNVSVDEILSINHFTGSHILHAGDKIKLPATATLQPGTATAMQQPVQQPVKPVVNATPAAAKVDTLVTTVHVVQKKETLFSIGKQYKVTVAQLKSWNNLKDNNIAEGQKLVVHTTVTGVAKDNAAVPQTMAAPPVVTSSPAATLQTEEKTSSTEPPTQKETQPIALANVPETGYFSSLFGRDVTGRKLQTANGLAMTFKTASGWADKKYYILMNDLAPGSIVQITNEDGKAIYAKVLWSMGDMKDNEGLNFRISDAAASALNLKATKFQLTVTYYE